MEKSLKGVQLFIFTMMLSLSVFTQQIFAAPHSNINPAVYEKINAFSNNFNDLLNIILGFMIVSCVLIFMLHIIKLGRLGSEMPALRLKIKEDLIVVAVCTACLGSVAVIYNLVIAIVLGN